MKLNEGLVVHTNLDEEDVIFIEKVIEGFCYYLPIAAEISLLIPDKSGESLIVIFNMGLNDNEVEINEGEIKKYSDSPEIKKVLETNKGIILDNVIYMPISSNHKEPFAVVELKYNSEAFNLDKFIKNISDINYMNDIYNKCFSKFIADAYIFMNSNGELTSITSVAEMFKKRIRAEDSDWFFSLWKSRESSMAFSEIINDKICSGVDYNLNGFEFIIITFPLFIEKEYQGMLISFYDLSIEKNMLREVINKSTVVKEVQHRVKNNLQTIASLLSLQNRRSNSPIVEKALTDSMNRITSIALVYEALTRDGTNVVNIGQCIKDIMSMILNNLVEPNKSITGEIRGKEIYLNSSQASNVSLCVNELLQNAVKHAFVLRKNGHVVVTLNQVNQEAIITIEDDGVGLAGKKIKGSSLGLQIIQLITKETLNGSFKLESHAYGTIAEIRFPL